MFERFAFLDISAPELLIILLILLLLFGSRKLPQLTKGIVDSARELKKGVTDDVSSGKAKPEAKKPPADKDSADS